MLTKMSKALVITLTCLAFVYRITPKVCPPSCICTTVWPFGEDVQCRNLFSVPDNIPPSTKSFTLKGNLFKTIKSGAFLKTPNLLQLKLYENGIEEISRGAFIGLKNLTYLYVSYNKIKKLPSGLFEGLSKLKHMGLRTNGIESIQRGLFKGLDTLEYIHLGTNKLEVLAPGGFEGMPKLDSMTLFHNRIGDIKPGAFKGLHELGKLNLGSSHIVELKRGVFSDVKKLQKLYLEDNRIDKARQEAWEDLANLEKLDMNHNKIKVIEKNSFKAMQKLEDMYMSNNEIEYIHSGAFAGLLSLRVLTLGYNKIVHIGGGIFREAAKLERLSLYNNKIKTIAVDSFKGLFNLGRLSLQTNNITTIEDGAFNDSKAMYRIALDENNISELKKLKDYGFSKDLWILILTGNKIKSLEAGLFQGLSNLLSITLLKNNISKIRPGAFRGLSSLMYLYLEENQIEVLPAGVFEGLSSLRYCYLNRNPIKAVHVGALSHLKALFYLSIRNCKITDLDPDVFNDVKRLWRLLLDYNNITTIRNGTFTRLSSLNTLSFINNKIEVIESGAFKGLYSLQYLFLDYNRISRFPSGLFNDTKSLKTLEVNFNKINAFPVVEEMTTLTQLLMQNNSLKTLRENWFKGLKNLQIVGLAHNEIEDIQSGTFKGLYKLSNLDLQGNNLSLLEEDMFADNSLLEILALGHNRITTLMPGLFKGLSSLKILYVAGNKISRLFPNTFQDLRQLYSLTLSGNQIKEIRDDHFSGLGALLFMSLAENVISHVSKGAFSETKSLESLSLWKNRLSSMPDGVFQGLNYLQNVILQDNQFSLIPDCSGAQIKQIFLVNNKINALPPMALKSSNDLTVLLLDNNKLERIQNNSFFGAFKMKTITLSRNPIKVIEEGAFLSLPNLERVNLLDTEIGVPVKIWPVATNITYFVSQAAESTFKVELINQRFQNHARIFLSSLGYICTWQLVTHCTPCKRGTFKSKVKDFCEVCPAGGFYQDEMAYVGAASYGLGCKQCSPGTYVKPEMVPGKSQTDCQSCPQGTDFKEVAKFRACKCLKNYHRLDRFGPCIVCTKGYICDKETVNLMVGFFWVWDSSQSQQYYEDFKEDLAKEDTSYILRTFKAGEIPQAYACPVAESCLGGKLSKCAVGYTGPLCAVCEKGFFNMMANCRKCPSFPWIISQIVLAVFLMAFIIFVILRDKKKKGTDSSRSLTDIFLARLKIVIGFYQVSSSTLESLSYISWPRPIVTMMRYAKLVQLNLLQIVPIHCIDDTITINAYFHFVMSIVLTAVVITSGFVANFILNSYIKANWFNRKDNQHFKLKQYKEKCYRCLFLILFITFPSTCAQIIQMLPAACHNICSSDGKNCRSYLKADYSVECNTSRHKIFGGLSIAAIAYCFGFPVFIILVLRRGRLIGTECKETQSINSVVIYNGMNFLYENYSPSCWFWEVVELFRKISLSSLLILLNAESRTSVGLTAVISGLYSVLFALHKPIEDGFEHWLQLVSLLVTSVNFTIGMLMKIPQDETSSGLSNEADSMIVTVILVAANIAVIVVISVKYTASMLQAFANLKKNPRCNASCCLEMLKIVVDAQGDMSGACAEPSMTGESLKSSSSPMQWPT